MKTGALYIRVSTHSQEELSPDAQRRLLLEYAAKNDILVSEQSIYEDGGISGRKADKRPQFQNMIAHARSKEHPFDVILVWKFSRFARNQEESIVYKSMLKRDNVDVISISEPLVDGPFGSLIERIIEWMDEYYSTRLSGEVFRGMSENALRGNYQARPPIGYRISHHRETPEIVPEEAEIVHLIFDMYTERGASIYDITKHLNELGYQTSQKKPFEKRSVTYILKNPSYTGKTVWNRHSNADSSLKEEDEWIIADGNHEAIITTEQFEKATRRYESEYRPTKQRPTATYKHWLSGMMKCSSCGRTLSACSRFDAKTGKRYINFQCYGFLKGTCSVSHQISERRLVPLIFDAFEQILNGQKTSFRVIDSDSPDSPPNRLLLLRRIDDIDKKETRIKQAYRDGIDTIEEYREQKEILSREREDVQNLLSKYESVPHAANHPALIPDRIRNVYEIIRDDSVSAAVKSDALRSVLQKIVFDRENGELDFHFYLTKFQ